MGRQQLSGKEPREFKNLQQGLSYARMEGELHRRLGRKHQDGHNVFH